MDVIAQLGASANWFLGYALPFLFVLTIVVFFHELGHFLVARWNRVDIDVFAVGFGRELVGFNDRYGTRWKFCLIPLGGYVKFAGDENAASVPDRARLEAMSEQERRGSFEHKRLSQKAAIVVAGPIANFILAIFIFAASKMLLGHYVTDPLITGVLDNSPAMEAGLEAGDLVVSIDGREVTVFADIPRYVTTRPNQELLFGIKRDGRLLEVPVTPQMREHKDSLGNVQRMSMVGITSDASQTNRRLKQYGPIQAFGSAIGDVWNVVDGTYRFIKNVVIGERDASQLGGPLRIAKVSGDVATFGITALIQLAGFLSVSIGLINLFPIPLLDGGHLVLYGIEAARGKPLSARAMDYAFRAGMFVILMLMVFVFTNDISQLFF